MFPRRSTIGLLLSCVLFQVARSGSIQAAETWDVHAALSCRDCHDSDVKNFLQSEGFHFSPGTRLSMEKVILTEEQILRLSQKCGECHEDAANAWEQSAHAVTYGEVFLNRDHNRVERLSQDCLRCHGMFFAKGIEDLIEPISVEGPWRIKPPTWDRKPAIPCLACHQAHPDLHPDMDRNTGAIYWKTSSATNLLTGFYDRRERAFIPLQDLPHPKVQESNQWLTISADLRLRLCYQCHAPQANHHAGTSDDKTVRGVHAGLSCLQCHGAHHLSARNSCQSCHPKDSHCGLEVQLMDTSFNAKSSRHDIHTVSCQDCHSGKRPDLSKK